ncbi:MAG: NAD-dependent epimerase/dehydratase [Myxococcales bacterium]|nr:NAD-dependent epimerase/dehydratase [Myxococcales bacterium]
MSGPWILVGCGYTGTRLARALVAQGAAVTITRRDPATVADLAASLGVHGTSADLGRPATLEGLVPPGAIVVCLAPPGTDPAAEIAALVAASQQARKLVYVSSTGVYGPGGGAWVDEAWPLAPITPSGRARVVAEAALQGASVPTVALRVAGIHGPGRGVVERLKAGTYRIIGDGRAHVSRIHVDDLVTAIIAAGTTPATGPINIADDDPAPIGEVGDTLAAALGVAAPPRVAVESVSPEVAGMLTADRRIANRRMKDELGVVLRYPSWRSAI